MQVCALLSQLHRHKEALAHSQIAIKISHYLIRDFHNLAKYYVKRIQNPNEEWTEQINNLKYKADSSQNNSAQRTGLPTENNSMMPIPESTADIQYNKNIDFLYDPKLSLLAKTAIKLLPVAEMLENRLVPERLLVNESIDSAPLATSENKSNRPNSKKGKKGEKEEFNTVFDKVDMRNLLGYLNQSDWIWSLNIGNIMQISPLTMQDIYTTSSIEYELSRELVLEKI